MKVVIAMDSFKGSLTGMQAGYAAAAGIRRVYPDAETPVFPAADGGEGTVFALTAGLHGQIRRVTVCGPLGAPVSAEYGILPDGTAVIETASAAGLTLLAPHARNPRYTTTYGVGSLICDALSSGCRRFLIGLGGSATNDGGAGMLQALGFDLLDADGRQIPPGAAGLEQLVTVSAARVRPVLAESRFSAACDVRNPLCGAQGCSAVFAPQKGADAAMIAEMDRTLAHYAEVICAEMPDADPNAPGAGAAGGLGFALQSCLHAQMQSGAELVLQMTGAAAALRGADLLVTGEGRLDAQTVMGKYPAAAANAAQQCGVPVIAFCGAAGEDAGVCNQHGIAAFFPILRSIVTQEQALDPERTKQNIADTAEQVFRLYKSVPTDQK